MSTNSRPTRSRVSSPFVSGSKTATTESSTKSADASAKPKTFLDRWVEPDRPAPRPSFAEAGLERHNVVLNMAPLGQLPSQKIRKSVQARPEGSDGLGRLANARKSVPSSASTPTPTPGPGEAIATPEPTAASQREQSVSTSKTDERLEETVTPPLPKTPQQASATSPKRSASRPSVPPPQSSGQGVFALQRSPISNAVPPARPTPTPTQNPSPYLPMINQNGFREVNFELCDKVVEVAVQEALDRYRYPTAYALRTLYDDHRANIRIVRLIESIYTESATDEQKTEFNSIMKHKKKEGKKGRTGEYYFNGDGSDPAPHRPIFQAINAINPPAPGPYQTPYTPLPPRPSSVTVSEPHANSSSTKRPSSESVHEDSDHAHVSKKPKPNDFEHDSTEVNGDSNGIDQSTKDMDVDITNNTTESNGGFHDDDVMDMDTVPLSEDANPPENGEEQRKSRSRSNSSSSSLSSVSEDAINGAFASAKNSPAVKSSSNQIKTSQSESPIVGSGHGFGLGPPVAQPRFVSPYTNANTFSAAAETLVRNQHQPITRQHKPGPRFHTFAVTPSTSSATAPPSSSTNTPPNTSTNTDSQSSTDPSMAPAALSPPLSKSSSLRFPPTFKIKNSKSQNHQPSSEDDQNSRLKRRARESAAANYNPKESFDRHQVVIPGSQEPDSQSDGPDFIAVAPSKRAAKKHRKIILNTRTRETRHGLTRANNYDSEENNLSSPTALGLPPLLAPGSTPSSRAATPSLSSRQPTRKAKTGTGLRVKSSPMKKKGGTSAGMPKGGERNNSPVGNGVSSAHQDAVENDDFCSACGGNGDLVCCDGLNCPRSFHFKCVDPPLIGDLPEEWFCNECLVPPQPEDDYPGIFGALIFRLDSKCPRAFSLPAAIRDYFEHVKTGTEGEYEEVQPAKPKNPKGWEEAPDYFRLKDAKGNTILCHHCNKQAEAPARSIICCTFCGLNWHMDCLPVPLAREPGPGRPWRCPAHVEDVLAKLPDLLGPAHRFRKIKGASVIRPAFSRGMKNNGYIEIENEPSEDDLDQGFYVQKEYGHVYKLPEHGIKLDFITKVKKSNGRFQRDLPSPPPKRRPTADVWNSRSLEDQQAALNLASMLPRSSVPEGTSRLISALLAGAPPAVVALIAQGSSDTISKPKLTREDKQAMMAAMELLKTTLDAAEVEPEGTADEALGSKEKRSVPALNGTQESAGADGDAEMLL